MRPGSFIGTSKVGSLFICQCLKLVIFGSTNIYIPDIAANVLIHEEGRLQLCDFGVATVIETKLDKRRTFIGTLHWMPPEMWDQKPEYSDEVRSHLDRSIPLCY